MAIIIVAVAAAVVVVVVVVTPPSTTVGKPQRSRRSLPISRLFYDITTFLAVQQCEYRSAFYYHFSSSSSYGCWW